MTVKGSNIPSNKTSVELIWQQPRARTGQLALA